jgi:replicative superfamily II helicase
MNKLIAAPTGSGKTLLFELGILQKFVKSSKGMKCLYIAPTKALCAQISIEWSNKYNVTGIIVKEITGDTEITDVIHIIAAAQLIITTPEKWDSVTRNWQKHLFLFAKIDLILLDEIHFVGDISRGGTYENIVTRMRIIYEEGRKRKSHADSLRFIALSATLPDSNMVEFGTWLNCTGASIHYFGNEFRPIPLRTHVLSYPLINGQNNYMFEKTLNAKVVDVVNTYSNGNQTLIFASTKNGTEELASFLLSSNQVSIVIPTCNGPTEYAIKQDINSIENMKLKMLIRAGYAFHHSGISSNDKSVVERLYLMGKIRILCSTSTLATGINLSAHLVIIKGTNAWRGTSAGYEAMARHEVIQMLGRAGRMGLGCNYGVGVIMCGEDQAHLYEHIEDRTEVIKSQLHAMLLEAIAVEVANGYIVDFITLTEWFQLSLHCIQLRKRRDFTPDLIQKILLSAVTTLKNGQIVEYDAESGAIKPSSFCHIMSRNMIKFSTMQLVLELKASSSTQDIVSQMCKSSDLDVVILRRDEKKFLNKAMALVRYPLKQKVQSPEQKAYVLILLMMEKIKVSIENFTLRLEQREICDNLLRLCAAITQVSVERKFGLLLENAYRLDRSIKLGIWDDCYASVYCQVSNISEAVIEKMLYNNIKEAEDLPPQPPERLQATTGCSHDEALRILELRRVLISHKRQLNVIFLKGNRVQIDAQCHGDGRSDSATTSIKFTLICYHARTHKLLLLNSFDNVTTSTVMSAVIGLETSDRITDIKILLLCNVVGLDATYGDGNDIKPLPKAKNNAPRMLVQSTLDDYLDEPKYDENSIQNYFAPASASPTPVPVTTARTASAYDLDGYEKKTTLGKKKNFFGSEIVDKKIKPSTVHAESGNTHTISPPTKPNLSFIRDKQRQLQSNDKGTSLLKRVAATHIPVVPENPFEHFACPTTSNSSNYFQEKSMASPTSVQQYSCDEDFFASL